MVKLKVVHGKELTYLCQKCVCQHTLKYMNHTVNSFFLSKDV